MNIYELKIIQSDDGLNSDIRSMVAQTREGVARTVNAGMTLLYWRIGKRIQTEVLKNERAEYGKEILSTLSQELTQDFGRGNDHSFSSGRAHGFWVQQYANTTLAIG